MFIDFELGYNLIVNNFLVSFDSIHVNNMLKKINDCKLKIIHIYCYYIIIVIQFNSVMT